MVLVVEMESCHVRLSSRWLLLVRVSPTWTRGGRERRSRAPGGLLSVNNTLTAAHRSEQQLRRVEVACHVLGRYGQQRFRSEAPQSFTRFGLGDGGRLSYSTPRARH